MLLPLFLEVLLLSFDLEEVQRRRCVLFVDGIFEVLVRLEDHLLGHTTRGIDRQLVAAKELGGPRSGRRLLDRPLQLCIVCKFVELPQRWQADVLLQ